MIFFMKDSFSEYNFLIFNLEIPSCIMDVSQCVQPIRHLWQNYHTVPAEKSLQLNLGLFGFDWVATEFKLSLIISYNI